MEHLLNLLWLSVVSVLVALTLRVHTRGKLRCSLPIALGCVALIALALFPALSMTDDIQRAKLYGHHGNLADVRLLEDSEMATTLLLVSQLLLLLAAALLVVGKITRRRDVLASPRTRGLRPQAVRPPPALALSPAV